MFAKIVHNALSKYFSTPKLFFEKKYIYKKQCIFRFDLGIISIYIYTSTSFVKHK